MPLTRTASGLLAADDFQNLNAWASGGVWTSVLDPSFVIFDPSPIPALLPGAPASVDYEGVREGQIFVDQFNSWFMLYDAGDGTNPWRQFTASSTNRGLSWTKNGQQSIYNTNGAGGTYAGGGETGWIEKRGSTYYLYRVTFNALAVADPPGIGLDLGPYGGDLWQCATLTGTWTWIRNFPLGSSLAASQNLPGSVFYDGSLYHFFNQVDNGYTARFSCATLAGTWVQDNTPINTRFDSNTLYAENPKVFWHAGLGRYCMLVNLISLGAGKAIQTAVKLSTSLTDWSAATMHRLQHVCPLDGANVVGVLTHLTAPDQVLMQDTSGHVGVVYDTNGVRTSPGFHQGRSILSAVLEASPACARYTSASATPFRMTNPTVNGDFVAEWAVEFRSIDASNGYMIFEFRRVDNANYYALTMHPGVGLRLYKYLAGVQSTLQTALLSTELPVVNLTHRLRVVATGTRIQAWLNGEAQINCIDTSFFSGPSFAFTASKLDGDIRRFSMRTGQTITVLGVGAGTVVTLRGAGGIPFASGVGPDPAFTLSHSPLSEIQIAGDCYQVAGGAYGGDSFQCAGMSAKSIFG